MAYQLNKGTNMNTINEKKLNLIESYVSALIESMDMSTLIDIAAQALTETLLAYTEQELVTEIHESYPELLEEVA